MGIIIAVDAGHGSKTAGKRTPPMPVDIDFDNNGVIDVAKGEAIREHIPNVGVSVFLEKELIRNGFSVVRSGWDDSNAEDDEDIALSTRQAKIKAANCKYSVSVHFNAYGDGSSFNSANGVSTYIHSNSSHVGNSQKLANYVQKYLIQGTSQTNRGVKSAAFAMCNCTSMGTKASILVELAFMTNLNEAKNMVGNKSFWKECAQEICKGFCEMEGKTYIEEKAVITQSYYRVRKKWTDSSSQAGAFQNFINAVALVDTLSGYYVFDENGTKLYPVEAAIKEGKKYAKASKPLTAYVTKDAVATITKKYSTNTSFEVLNEYTSEWYRVKCVDDSLGTVFLYNENGEGLLFGTWLYTIQSGDTLWKIAEKYLGSGSKYTQIMKWNNMTSTTLTIGEKLLISAAE